MSQIPTNGPMLNPLMTRNNAGEVVQVCRPAEMTACLVTRAIDSFVAKLIRQFQTFEQTIVHENSVGQALGVFGRYVAVKQARNELIYTQDDDVLIDPTPLFDAWRPGRIVINVDPAHKAANRALYGFDDIRLLGFGAVFERWMVDQAFAAYSAAGQPIDALFFRECDRVFTGLTPGTIEVESPITHIQRPVALSRETDHLQKLQDIRARVDIVRQLKVRII